MSRRKSSPPAAKSKPSRKWSGKDFARVADKKHSAGFYANVIFAGTPTIVAQLHAKFALNEDVFRVMFTDSPEPKPAK